MRNREEKTWMKKFVVYFIAFIMIGSIGGFIIVGSVGSPSKVNYNGYKMERKGAGWSVDLDKKQALFNFFPGDVADITIDDVTINRLKGTLQIDVTSSINHTYTQNVGLGVYEMSQELNFHYNKFVRPGFLENNSFNVPIITCEDATPILPVIYFKEGNETKVYSEGNCIIAETLTGIDIIRVKDRLLYGIHGII